MMAEYSSSGFKADLHMQYLKNLHESFVPPPLTEKQESEKEGRRQGRELWLEVLKVQHKLRPYEESCHVGTNINEENDEDFKLSDPVRTSYEDYLATYQVEIKSHCEHETHAAVRINERGNLCEDLPFLALTCRQILDEMWGWCFPAQSALNTAPIKEKGIRYTVKVMNFDFLPIFRFLQMLRRGPTGVHVQGGMVDIVWEDDGTVEATADFKYERVKRLVESHWLDGLPMWGCLTGIRKYAREDGPKEETKIREVFSRWLYRVRQVVALYHIRRSEWRKTSIKHLKCCDVLEDDDDREEQRWEIFSDAQIFEATIARLKYAIEYRCGSPAYWEPDCDHGSIYSNGSTDWKDAYGLEHAKVHLTDRYCMRVGKMLRNELGDWYGEWERLEDEKLVPMDILL